MAYESYFEETCMVVKLTSSEVMVECELPVS